MERLLRRARALESATCLTLAHGFPAPATIGNYALDPHFHLPYVQAWNLDVQKTLPWGIVMNVGYNGSKGNHLDIVTAPRAPGEQPADQSDQSDLSLRISGGFFEVQCGHAAGEQAADERHCAGRELSVLALDRRCGRAGQRGWCGRAELDGHPG